MKNKQTTKEKIKEFFATLGVSFLFWGILIFAYPSDKPIVDNAFEVKIAPVEASTEKEETMPDYCGLTAVECQNERKTYALEGEFSAYNAEVAQTDGDPFITASNKKVREGIVATNLYPIGTEIEVEGLGKFVVEDRMNPRYNNQPVFDIFMWDKGEALKFGRKNLKYNLL